MLIIELTDDKFVILVDDKYVISFFFYTWPHNSCGVLWFHVGRSCVHPSICRTSIHISFLDDNLSNGFHQTFMCVDIVEMQIGELCQLLTELSGVSL